MINLSVGLITGVAPHTGAWIETLMAINTGIAMASHPTRVRGLKHDWIDKPLTKAVAPHTGAWIETFSQKNIDIHGSRTPHGCVD